MDAVRGRVDTMTPPTRPSAADGHLRLEPEATGTVGPGATWTHDERGRRVQADPLRCELAGWLGGHLVDVTPDLVVSAALARTLRTSGLTGFELRPAVVTLGEEHVSYAGPPPTSWERLVVTGDADAGDDLAGPASDGALLVSPRAHAVLTGHDQRRVDTPTDEAGGDGAEEAARLTVLADRSGGAGTSPTLRTNAGREVTGDLALAASALGRPLEDEAVLAVVRLMSRPLAYDAGRTAYLSSDGSVVLHVRRGSVSGVEVVLRPHRNAPHASYPRPERLFGEGVDTRPAVHAAWGEPASTRVGRRTRDEYLLGERRVQLHWDGEDRLPSIVVVGTKA